MSSSPDLKHLAHDLNNIFSRILGSIDLLRSKIAADNDLTSLLNNIEASTYLASEILEDSILAGQQQNKLKRISFNSIINEIAGATLIPNQKFEFKLDLDPNLKPVIGKYSDFYRLLLNLITNSSEAITANGCISITTNNRNTEKNIEIIIKDNGKGIDKTSLPLIFNESFSTKSSISGFGLSVVKKVIEAYHGSIEVESSPGVGSIFKIKLPAAESIDLKHVSGSKSILIAEDESVLRELLVDLLQSYGYKVVSVSNGKELLNSFENNPHFDLLIIDNKMPDMDGTTCIKEIEKTNKEIPIILASGSQLESDYNFTQKNIRIITKPYNFEELLLQIEELTR
jgi:two-component system, cell cycle sensor histidine kinase and response regulator CckA